MGIANDKDNIFLSRDVKHTGALDHHPAASFEFALDQFPGRHHRIPGSNYPGNRNGTAPDEEVRVLAGFSRTPLHMACARPR